MVWCLQGTQIRNGTFLGLFPHHVGSLKLCSIWSWAAKNNIFVSFPPPEKYPKSPKKAPSPSPFLGRAPGAAWVILGSLQLFLRGLWNPKLHFSTPKTKRLRERNALREHNIALSFLGCNQPRCIPCTADARENPNPWTISFLNIELQSLILSQKPPRFSLVWQLQLIFLQLSGPSLCSSTVLEHQMSSSPS